MLNKKSLIAIILTLIMFISMTTISFAFVGGGTVNCSALNVRSYASVNATVVDVVYYGEWVDFYAGAWITDPDDGNPYTTEYTWAKVLTPNGVTGWCAVNYINQSGP